MSIRLRLFGSGSTAASGTAAASRAAAAGGNGGAAICRALVCTGSLSSMYGVFCASGEHRIWKAAIRAGMSVAPPVHVIKILYPNSLGSFLFDSLAFLERGCVGGPRI